MFCLDHPRVRPVVASQPLVGTGIRGAVVDDDDLDVVPVLCEYAIDRVVHVRAVIEARHQDGDHGQLFTERASVPFPQRRSADGGTPRAESTRHIVPSALGDRKQPSWE